MSVACKHEIDLCVCFCMSMKLRFERREGTYLRLLSVVANTTAALASYAFVIQAFVPLIIQSSPSLVAVVDAAPASLPFPGSDSPKQPIFSESEPSEYGVFEKTHVSKIDQDEHTRLFNKHATYHPFLMLLRSTKIDNRR